MAKTLYDKLWDAHVVRSEEDGTALLYIDRHLVHEVTSPQAFEGLRIAGRKPWRTDSIIAVPDHNVPTSNRSEGITDAVAKIQVETLASNCKEYAILELLALRKGSILTKEMFLNHLYGGIDEPDLKIIDVFKVSKRYSLYCVNAAQLTIIIKEFKISNSNCGHQSN